MAQILTDLRQTIRMVVSSSCLARTYFAILRIAVGVSATWSLLAAGFEGNHIL